jgi:hypothetical protein
MVDDAPIQRRNVLQNRDEFSMSKVTHLPTPQTLHPLDAKVFQEDEVVVFGELVCQFELPVTALVDYTLVQPSYTLVQPSYMLFCSLPVARPLDLTTQAALCLSQLVKRLMQEQRGFIDTAIRARQECGESEVIPDGDVTRPIRHRHFVLNHETQPQDSQCVSLHRHRPDASGHVTALGVPIDLPLDAHAVGFQQLPSRLLEGEGAIFPDLPEAWGRRPDSSFDVSEEQLVGFVDTLHDVLDGLRAHQIPVLVFVHLLEFGDVLHQLVLVQMLAVSSVVSAMESNAVVPDDTSDVYLLMKVAITLVAIQLVSVGTSEFHRFFWSWMYRSTVSCEMCPTDSM